VVKKKSISGKGARKKGLNFEREIARRLRGIQPELTRNFEFRSEDARGVDIGPVRAGSKNFVIQCKRNRAYASISKIEEIQTRGNEIRVLCTKGDRLEAMAVIPMEELFKLMEFYHENFDTNSNERSA